MLLFSIGSSAMASIALPDLPRFELATHVDSGPEGAGATGDPAESSDRSPSEQTPAVSEFALLLGGPASSTTGTSTGTSAGMPLGMLLHPASSVGLNDPAVSGWVSGENCLFLPTPPGNDLLRPPQV